MTPVGFLAALRRLLQQAWPVLVAQWASVAFGVLDTAMTGHASPLDLAAMALAVSIYITVFVALIGVLNALVPVLSYHFGAGRLTAVGEAWGQGLWLALGLTGVGALILLHPDPWLAFAGDEIGEDVRTRIRGYLLALTWALPAALVFRTMHALGSSVSRPQIIMWINLCGVGFKAFFNWLLIFGHWGLPALGAVGAGISTALVFWISASLGAWVLWRDRFFHPLRLRVARPHWPTLRELLRLGVPMGGSYLVEVVAFTFMALMVAREGVAATGAHQITANLAAICYMAPLSIGIASAAQTAQALGGRRLDQARELARAGLALTLGAALITLAVLMGAGRTIVAFYTSDARVAVLALSLMAILPFFQLADALQTLVVYLLRAYKVTVIPLCLQILALGVVGLLGGWWLAFGSAAGTLAPLIAVWAPAAPPGAAALWIMATAGMVMSFLLLLPVYLLVARRYHARFIHAESARDSI